jgi:hypothetical protein
LILSACKIRKMNHSRRSFIKLAGLAGLTGSSANWEGLINQGKSPELKVINPLGKVPISLIIDDSTCLVNLAHFGIPQFAEVFPENYRQDWRKLPREIPDSFVREFGEWAVENGVKGKYSIVPYPACTGWVNRFIPGWTKQELDESLRVVREFIAPNWDIHPEMVSHTRVIDIRTGRPFPYPTPEYMENWEWSQDKSADELAAYQSYALSILKDAGLYCEGLTTPGGYGSKNQANLALGSMQALREVYNTEIPHFFRDLFTEKGVSVKPRLINYSPPGAENPDCVVSMIGCTDDWFGGWDGLNEGKADNFISEDLSSGRLVEVIDSNEPAIMVCHWPGIYFNGEKKGFNILKEVRKRLYLKYKNLIWMKLCEIARYWAVRELVRAGFENKILVLDTPYSCPCFTLEIRDLHINNCRINYLTEPSTPLVRVSNSNNLINNSWYGDRSYSLFCLDLKKGINKIHLE